jgi:hypothetical protein
LTARLPHKSLSMWLMDDLESVAFVALVLAMVALALWIG